MPNPITPLGQGFPQITMPLVDPDTGIMNQAWYQFLIAMFQRTGGGPGVTAWDAMTVAALGDGDGVPDFPLSPAYDIGGAEPPPTPPDEAALMALAFADDSGSGDSDQPNVFLNGIVVFNGAAIQGGLILTDTGFLIQAGGETINGGAAIFGGQAVQGGLVVTDTGLNVQAGGATITGSGSQLVVGSGTAVSGGLGVTGGINVSGASGFTGNMTLIGDDTITGNVSILGGAGLGVANSLNATAASFSSLSATNATLTNISVSAVAVNGIIAPPSNGAIPDGFPTLRWDTTYLVNNPDVSSDRRLKKDFQALTGDLVDQVSPVAFRWKEGDQAIHLGFVAQEVQAGLGPEAASFALVGTGPDGMLSLVQAEMLPILWAKVQQIDGRVKALEAVA